MKLPQQLPSVLAVMAVAFTATSQAATLANPYSTAFGNSTAGTVNFNVSVNSNNAGYYGVGASGTFDGTIEDYAFYKQGATSGTIAEYSVNASSNRIGTATLTNGSTAGNESFLKLWDTNDPGSDLSTPSTTANFTGNSMLKNNGVTADIDITGMSQGALYLFYGNYRSTLSNFTITLTDTDGILSSVVLTGAGQTNTPVANNNETWIAIITFADAADYETLTFRYNNSDANRGRLGGVVLTNTIPEPSAAVFGILSCGLLLLRRRR